LQGVRKKMKTNKINRRVFETITGLIVLGLTIGLTFVFLNIAHYWGYSYWYALLLFPTLLICVSAYIVGVPYIVYRVAKTLFHRKDEENIGVWFFTINVTIWLCAIPIVFIFGLFLSAYFAKR
jgi:hypothetical protein